VNEIMSALPRMKDRRLQQERRRIDNEGVANLELTTGGLNSLTVFRYGVLAPLYHYPVEVALHALAAFERSDSDKVIDLYDKTVDLDTGEMSGRVVDGLHEGSNCFIGVVHAARPNVPTGRGCIWNVMTFHA